VVKRGGSALLRQRVGVVRPAILGSVRLGKTRRHLVTDPRDCPLRRRAAATATLTVWRNRRLRTGARWSTLGTAGPPWRRGALAAEEPGAGAIALAAKQSSPRADATRPAVRAIVRRDG
jgi:hypothetical protein